MGNQRSGFSLLEAAIVLAVVGMVIGGIWTAAAAAVAENNTVNTMSRAILQGCS